MVIPCKLTLGVEQTYMWFGLGLDIVGWDNDGIHDILWMKHNGQLT
jgi:hypothetical protein